MLRSFFAVCAFCVALISCSSAEKKERERGLHPISRFAIENLHVRRPSSPSADPQAGPGGVDYRSDPLPNERLDCEPAIALFKDFIAKKTRECVRVLQALGNELEYQLRRAAVPFLELQVKDDTPGCAAQLLSRLPVPREIFFQSNDNSDGVLQCYSSRLNLEKEKILAGTVTSPLSRSVLKLKFPLQVYPRDDEQMNLMFLTWVLSPFFRENGKIPSRIVPHALCERCFTEKRLLKPDGPPPVYWPVK